MERKTITDLTALTTPADGDLLVIVDVSDTTDSANGTTKKIAKSNLVTSGGVSDGDKGDITVSSSGTVWTIDNGAVSYAKMQDVSATGKVLGRVTTGSGDIEEISIDSDLTAVSASDDTVPSAKATKSYADTKITQATADGLYAPIAKGVTNGDSHDHSGGDGSQINHTTLSNIGSNTHAQIDTHIANTSNPHSVTASQVGAVANTLVDAKGDLISASADNTPARLAVGANGKYLVARSGETTGLKWEVKTPSWINVVTDYGAAGDGSTDDTTPINNAIAAASAGDNVIYFPSGRYKVSSALTTITANGILFLGDGESENGSIIEYSGTTGNIITFDGAQFCGVRNMAFKYTALPTSGYCIVFQNSSFNCFVEDCRGWNVYNGIQINGATETKINRVSLRYLVGTRGIEFTGTSSDPSYRIAISGVQADNPYPNGVYGTVKTWATSTAFSLNDIIRVNNNIYQCSTAGTSAGAGGGPSGVPGTTATNAFTTEIDDGTAKWKFVCQTLRWIVQDNYAYSLVIRDSALINGYEGFATLDTAASGTSYPIWHYMSDIETDHSYNLGVNLERGEGLYATNSWVGSALTSSGIYFGSNYRGEGSITNTRVMGCWGSGILVNGGEDYTFVGNVIGDNSVAGSGSYHGIVMAANINQFTIVGNKIGDVLGSGTNNQGYGVFVSNGTSENYYVQANILEGNVTAGCYDGGTGTIKEIQESAWVSYTPTWTNITVGNGTTTAAYKKIGKVVYVRAAFALGNTSSIGGAVSLSLPITAVTYSTDQSIGTATLTDDGTATYLGQVVWTSTTTAKVVATKTDGTYATQLAVNTTVPFTWATADAIKLSFFYEAA